MTHRQNTGSTDTVSGQGAEMDDLLGSGDLWIGQHAADQDILVFDPSEADRSAEVLSLYSLTQHRMRSFPRATVAQKIQPLTDEVARARAKHDYDSRASRRETHEQQIAVESSERRSRQRDSIMAAHRRYVEAHGLEYQGERETGASTRRRRRTKCQVCGIALDNFAAAECVICDGVLCSCGACACGSASTTE